MQRADPGALLDAAQVQAADAGLKAMIPVGRPFLDYVLDSLAEAGIEAVCLVIGPEHHAIRERYTREVRPTRLRIAFAIQEQPLGAADAVLAAESFAGVEPFLVLNADNLYPVDAIRALRLLGGPGLVAFERDALVRDSNIDADRIATYALVRVNAAGELEQIVEKPTPAEAAMFAPDALISMNLWAFGPSIFHACRRITPSPRGELELQTAVQYARDTLGEVFPVIRCAAGVLDLSRRADIAVVTQRLAGREVRF